MLRENILTSQLINSLQNGKIKKILRSSVISTKNIEFRREVGNNSFFADILISLYSQKIPKRYLSSQKTKFIAIEVKISDWKQGLYQAWRYYSFAEKSYLALYKDYADKVDINEFKKYNVGLIIFDEKNVEIPFHPVKVNILKNQYRLEVKETIWRRSLAIESIQPAI